MPASKKMPFARKSPAIACEDCGKQFKSHYILILHARYHRKESNYIFQRNAAATVPPDAEASHESLPDEPSAAAVAASPHAVLGQLSPPHLPNPVVTATDDELPAARNEEIVGVVSAGGADEDEDEYSAEEAGVGGVRRVGGGGDEDDYDEEEIEEEEEEDEMECDQELECEICDARFHLVLELLKHIRVHRYELTESNYQQYRRKVITTYRPNDVHVDLRRLGDEATGAFGGSRGGADGLGAGGQRGGAAGAAAAAAGGTEYECDYCGKRFPTASNLRRHIPVHTGERPHQCPFCGCRFGDRSYMLKHTRFVHNVELARVQKAKTRPRYASSACFKCQICNRYFENGDILAVHLEKYHSRPGHGPRRQPDRSAEEDEYPEEEDALLAGRQQPDADAETLFSCDQCDFISADVGQLHAHMAQHAEAAAGDDAASTPVPPPLPPAVDDSKPRLTVTISDG